VQWVVYVVVYRTWAGNCHMDAGVGCYSNHSIVQWVVYVLVLYRTWAGNCHMDASVGCYSNHSIPVSNLFHLLGPGPVSSGGFITSFFCMVRAFRLASWVTWRPPAILKCFSCWFGWSGMGATRECSKVARRRCTLWNECVLMTKHSMGLCSIYAWMRLDSTLVF